MKKTHQILLAFCFVVLPLIGFSQFTDTRQFKKTFKVGPETRIEISNKYGKLEVNTWDKDSVVFEVKIKVEEKKLSKLERSMEDIDFDFNNSQHFLIARTLVHQNKTPLQKEFMKFKENVLQAGGNIEINYTVWLPKTCNLKLENKYGNIFMDDFSGEINIDLSNGTLKAHEFSGKTTINLNFGDASINKMADARISSTYSDIYIKNAKNLRVESKQTTFEVLELESLDVTTSRDKYRIRLIDMFEARGSFSNFRISELNDRITLRSDFGDINVEKIQADFSNILIESRSTDINLYFEPETHFNFEITHTKSELDFSRKIEISEETILDEKDKKIKVKGSFGTPEDNAEKLYINATSGEVNLFDN